MLKYIFLLNLVPFILFSQENKQDNPWKLFEFLIGSWSGDETGKSGTGKGERNYQFILNYKYIKMNNKSRFEPQEKNPGGETHEDLSIFSIDNNRNLIVMRQFNVEGFVNKFVLDTLKSDSRNFIFETEYVENAPEELKARLTYKIISKDEFNEIFEIALPGKEYEIWLRNFWRKNTE